MRGLGTGMFVAESDYCPGRPTSSGLVLLVRVRPARFTRPGRDLARSVPGWPLLCDIPRYVSQTSSDRSSQALGGAAPSPSARRALHLIRGPLPGRNTQAGRLPWHDETIHARRRGYDAPYPRCASHDLEISIIPHLHREVNMEKRRPMAGMRRADSRIHLPRNNLRACGRTGIIPRSAAAAGARSTASPGRRTPFRRPLRPCGAWRRAGCRPGLFARLHSVPKPRPATGAAEKNTLDRPPCAT